jgi:NAD(P)-dependent dehydrogenase (short-subunit alcohol dehydrogenase family)
MPGLVPGIHVLAAKQDVDSRDEPGHDGKKMSGELKTRREQRREKHPVRSHRQGRRHHRIEPRHRPLVGRTAGQAWRQGGDLQPQGRRLQGSRRRYQQGGRDAHVIACNISRREEVEALIAGTVKHYGKIDILVCNAAVNPYYGPLLDIKDEAFDKIMGSNVKSNIWLCALAIPQMAERGNGSVVIISSIGGLRGSTVIGAYGISKAADFALCRSLAGEWGPKGVRVNCVAPGLVKTDFAKALWEDEERLKRRCATTPLRRIGEPDEIAGAVAYLGSDASSFMTGQTIVVDGGVTTASA